MLNRLLRAGAAAVLLCALSAAAAADPITLTAGGPAVTVVYQSAAIPGASAQATFSLSADRRTINFSFQNTSPAGNGAQLALFTFTGIGGGVPFVTPSAFGLTLPPGTPAWIGPTDVFGQFDYFPRGYLEFRRDPLRFGPLPGLLNPGQGGSGFVSFSFDLPQQITLTSFVTFVTVGSAGQVTFGGADAVVIPEPGTLALIGTGLGLVAARLRRRKSRQR
jgi:hypothetical protein